MDSPSCGVRAVPLLQPAWPSRLPLAPAAPTAGRPVKTLGASAPSLTRRASREAARGRWRTPAPIERVIVRGTELKVTYDVTGRRCILGSSIMGVEGFFLLPFLAGGVQGCGLNKGCYPRTYTHAPTPHTPHLNQSRPVPSSPLTIKVNKRLLESQSARPGEQRCMFVLPSSQNSGRLSWLSGKGHTPRR